MTPVEYYIKNKKVYHYTPTESELEEIQTQRRKMLYARSKAEKEAADKYYAEHKGGYCPKCFLLRPMTGICPNCD